MSRRDFGRYKIAEELGRGAMGVVYRATDPLLGRSVAIKAINQAYIEHLGISPDEYYQRFRREAEVAGGLNHPHIVKIFDLGPDYIVMELVEGQSLEAVLRAKARFTLSRILEIVVQVADALDHAHAQGIVHRDIKPANIMLRTDGRATVMDFGLARIESSTLTAAGELLGSASYMAPEVVLGTRADAKSDVFALGVVAYELMTGERPFAGPSITSILYKIVQEAAPSAHALDLNVPPEYDAIFGKVLAKEPANRYSKAGDFASDLVLKKWADRDPVLAARDAAAAEPTLAALLTSPRRGTEEASPLEELVVSERPSAGVPAAEAAEPLAEAPASASTFIMPAPAAKAASPVSPEAPATAPQEPESPITVRLHPQGAPPAALPRVQLSGQTTWGPESGRSRSGPPGDLSQQPVPEAGEQPPAEATVMMEAAGATPPRPGAAPTPSPPGGDAGAATVIQPPSTPPRPAVPGPDDTGPFGLSAEPAAPPAAGTHAPRAPRRGPSPALLLGGLAAVLLVAVGTLAGLGYFLFFRRVPVAPSPEPAFASQGSPAEAAQPLPEDETQKSASPAPDEASPSPAEASPPAAPEEAPAPSAPQTAASAEPLRPDKAPATLVVGSQPSGARVRAGGARGLTPWRLTLPPGMTTVVVEKEGFQPWRRRLTLVSGRTEQVSVRLVPLPASAPPSRPPEVKTGDLVALTPDVTPPRRLSGEAPSYPEQAQKRKLGGSVLLEFVVSESGAVSQPEVLESAGEILDRVAIEAVSGWRYQPAEKAGVKVKVKQQARFNFKAR